MKVPGQFNNITERLVDDLASPSTKSKALRA